MQSGHLTNYVLYYVIVSGVYANQLVMQVFIVRILSSMTLALSSQILVLVSEPQCGIGLALISSYGQASLLAIGVLVIRALSQVQAVMIQYSSLASVYSLGSSSSLATCIISIVITLSVAACITTYGAQALVLVTYWALQAFMLMRCLLLVAFGNYNTTSIPLHCSSVSSSKGGDTEVILVQLNPGVSKVHDGVAMNSFLI